VTREPMWKDGETPKTRRARRTRKNAAAERRSKQKVRARDKHCRVPLCGCRKLWRYAMGDALLKFFATVSHDKHKGIGGNPAGDRSVPELMIYLCKWRHQDAPISIHAGNLENVHLTPEGNNGPIEWRIKREALELLFVTWPIEVSLVMSATVDVEWLTLARETKPQLLEPLEPWQRIILERLGEMER
jgi:hypothetical protein